MGVFYQAEVLPDKSDIYLTTKEIAMDMEASEARQSLQDQMQKLKNISVVERDRNVPSIGL